MLGLPITVAIADDHPIVLEGLHTLLNAAPRIKLVGRARNAAELHTLLASTTVDVLVLDLGGMGEAPLTLVYQLRRTYPSIAVVVFSSSVDLAPEVLRAGVRGYIVKEDLGSHLVAAVYAAHAGQSCRSTAVEDYLLQTTTMRHQHHLAPKEVLVLQLLAQGFGTVEIAEQMQIDSRSVQNYITALRRKLGVAERVQLVNWYRRMYGDDA